MASLRLIVCALVLASCYEIPRPACGFQCGPPAVEGGNGTCPDGYACDGNRCKRLLDLPVECPPIEDPDLVDNTPPTVQTREPMADESDVELEAVILVTFDEEVVNVTAATFGVSAGAGFVNGAVSDVSGRTFRFTPDRPLAPNRVYEVVLGSAIVDLAANPLAETRWTFSTIEDRTGPMIVSSSPANGATGVDVAAPLRVTFDEEIVGVSLTSVRLEQNGTVLPTMLALPAPTAVRIEHDPLAAQTVYTLVLTDDLRDLQGNPITPTTITFTTGSPP